MLPLSRYTVQACFIKRMLAQQRDHNNQAPFCRSSTRAAHHPGCRGSTRKPRNPRGFGCVWLEPVQNLKYLSPPNKLSEHSPHVTPGTSISPVPAPALTLGHVSVWRVRGQRRQAKINTAWPWSPTLSTPQPEPSLFLPSPQAAYLHGLLKRTGCRASNRTTQQQFNANTDRISYRLYITSRLSRSIGSRALPNRHRCSARQTFTTNRSSPTIRKKPEIDDNSHSDIIIERVSERLFEASRFCFVYILTKPAVATPRPRVNVSATAFPSA
ncbi:hypothetical protein F4801DRAFT_53075 [Xylaria longipes]|nr:hypothetical protein F4801DRAFT_53075 [Xylaria longipes]